MIESLQSYARKGLEAELARLDAERERLRALLASLDRASRKTKTTAAAVPKRPRQMSEAGRHAIREAVKRRWERVRADAAASADGSGGKTERPPAVLQKRTPRATRTGNRKK